jgi:hypothetical protein
MLTLQNRHRKSSAAVLMVSVSFNPFQVGEPNAISNYRSKIGDDLRKVVFRAGDVAGKEEKKGQSVRVMATSVAAVLKNYSAEQS